MCIEPIRDINKLIPFGLKVFVTHKPPSKVEAPSKPLICLGYEDHSDALRFFDSTKRHVVISRDYSPTQLAFRYNSPAALTKPPDTLPQVVSLFSKSSKDRVSFRIKSADMTMNPTPNRSTQEVLSRTPSPVLNPTPMTTHSSNGVGVQSHQPSPHDMSSDQSRLSINPTPNLVDSAPQMLPTRKATSKKAKHCFEMVPAGKPPAKEIVGDIDPRNIVSGVRRRGGAKSSGSAVVPPAVTDPPEELLLLHFDVPNTVYLTETVSIKEALASLDEHNGWKEAMAKEYHLLASKNTGTLVPPPGDDKVIGGMWLFGQKKNEFGELLRFKARWVCFGNHQVHMLHYFDTYASVARNESFKLLLSVAVNRSWNVFQFDVETTFLYGEIDAPVYVAQVEGFEEPGKENWVWKLNKSLYGTKQAPRQWRKHLVGTLTALGLECQTLRL
jgi:hypothetical protein